MAWVVVVGGLLGAVLICLVGSGFVWFPWVVSLFMLVVGDSGFGVCTCCTVEVCGVVCLWCWLHWLWSVKLGQTDL